jgi:hypothetical protein
LVKDHCEILREYGAIGQMSADSVVFLLTSAATNRSMGGIGKLGFPQAKKKRFFPFSR